VNRDSPTPDKVELQAQRLVHTAGSPENAKQAIDAAIDKESAGDFRQDAFALRFGFASRRDLLAASKPLFDCETSDWWATQLKDGRWIVWGREDLSAKSTFETLEAARRAVSQPALPEAEEPRSD